MRCVRHRRTLTPDLDWMTPCTHSVQNLQLRLLSFRGQPGKFSRRSGAQVSRPCPDSAPANGRTGRVGRSRGVVSAALRMHRVSRGHTMWWPPTFLLCASFSSFARRYRGLRHRLCRDQLLPLGGCLRLGTVPGSRECQDEMSGPAGDGATSGLWSSLFSFGSVVSQLHDQAFARLLSRSLVRHEMCTHHVQLDSSRKQMMRVVHP